MHELHYARVSVLARGLAYQSPLYIPYSEVLHADKHHFRSNEARQGWEGGLRTADARAVGFLDDRLSQHQLQLRKCAPHLLCFPATAVVPGVFASVRQTDGLRDRWKDRKTNRQTDRQTDRGARRRLKRQGRQADNCGIRRVARVAACARHFGTERQV